MVAFDWVPFNSRAGCLWVGKSLFLDTLLAQQFVLLCLNLGVNLGAFGGLIAVVTCLCSNRWLVSWLLDEERRGE